MEVLSSFVLALHLACMNVFAAGPLVCAWLDRNRSRHNPETRTTIQRLAWSSLLLMALGALLGTLVGWLRWHQDYQNTLSQFSYRITWGIVEFAFSAVLTLVYAVWLWKRPIVNTAEWIARTLVALISATNLLYHFPPLFSLIGAASSGQLAIEGKVDSATFVRLIARGEVMALTAHFALASFALSGIALAWLDRRAESSETSHLPLVATGARFALIATVAQIPVGLWLVLSLPAREQRRIMGGDGPAALVFVLAMVGTFLLLHQLAGLAFGAATRKKVWQVTASVLAVVGLMTFVLERGRLSRSGSEGASQLSNRTLEFTSDG